METLGNSGEKKSEMCGIAGYTGAGDESILKNMIQAIKHRGPDIQDTFIQANLGLAHARLSILDLNPGGNQPMFSSDRKIAIVFNGEIYNYISLKKELSNKYEFHNNTDTEVLLYLYKEHGIKMLDKMKGMFAFAIYDFEDQSLFLARDIMGKKPLYYTTTNSCFVFGSELKSILKHPKVTKELNIEAVNQYLTFDYVPTPNSIIKNVSKLEPGHYLVVKNNHVVIKEAYWQHNFTKNDDITFNNASEKLDSLLNNATKKRLMSDVPLGVFLSGGLDSSTIAYYAQKNSSNRIKTFSIGFEDKSYDETNYAKQVAQHLDTEHHTGILTQNKTLELINKIYKNIDEPFADASLIPTYFLSEFTKNHVTVALGGDGSDELLAGYPTFVSNYFTQPLASLPNAIPSALLKMTNGLMKVNDNNISLDFKIKQYLRGFLSKKNHIHQLWLGSFTPDEKKRLFKPEVYASLQDNTGLNIIDSHFSNANKEWSNFDKITYYYYQTYLLDDILVKVDRASMLNSLEVRSPFLDKDVVEFVNTIPQKYKLKGFSGKHLLKKMMENKLPQNITSRSKKGFGIPLSQWIREDLKEEITSILLSEDSYFNQNYIQHILKEHFDKKRNHRKLIWNLYLLKFYMINNNLI
ncbi:MAG: asparagine synthase (glutamine-hydrolyzing) [Flavobacteriales bacterium]|nr:MAG: asparagine synthase (glutamine-hydrolyzing) [Flavobacteriales bacterium]